MKKFCAIILCLCIILTGCQGKKNKADKISNDNEATQAVQEDNSSEDKEDSKDNSSDNKNNSESTMGGNNQTEEKDIGKRLLTLSTVWSSMESFELAQPVYEEPGYQANVKPYTVAKDLSNIENLEQFSGFTKEQTKMLVNNGFVVLPSNDTRMYYVYDNNEYKGVPNFITSDSVLHLYHQFYDKSLISVESGYLYEDLELMTKQMLDKSILLLEELQEEDLKALQKKNIIYFLVARMLMQQSTEIPVKVDKDLLSIAKQEYEQIQAAEGYLDSPLLGNPFDYSQFKVRGHYTKSEELGRYFKTMMWFGTAPYNFEDDSEDGIIYDNVIQSLLVAYMTFSESEVTCDAELWSNIYLPTSQYVGVSDDIDVFTLNGLRLSVFGEKEDPNIFNDIEYRDKLKKAVKALPAPQIAAKLITLPSTEYRQFRFMGQRYVLDSDILQELIENIKRPIPSSLDVMGVLGSDLAENLLFNVYKPQKDWPDYTAKYNNMKDKVSSYSTDYWKGNLYTGWLWSLQAALTEYDNKSGMPFFMTNNAWKNKTLNTALGSYTELKHDTVLYGKQAVAEMGGPDATATQHYVEPNISLYSKLLYLTDFTASVLDERGMQNEKLKEGADSYKELLKLLITCSEKELKNEPLSEDEKRRLLWYGGTMENIMMSFLYGSTEDYEAKEMTDMLVSDITTSRGNYLSLGTGYFDEIYVVVPVEGKLYLARGAVYSFYEFISDKRLTDQEWWELQGITIKHEDYGDYPQIGEPSELLPEQPEWIKSFKSDKNEVTVTSLEVIWDDLTE